MKRFFTSFFCFFLVFAPLHSQARLGDLTIRGQATQEMVNTGLVAAHPSLPINSEIKIRNPRNGNEIEATVVDRIQPSVYRIVDLSRDAASALGIRSGDQVILSTFTLPPAENAPAIAGELITLASVQSQGDIRLFITPVMAPAEQATFLLRGFEAEANAGGYRLSRNRQDAHYILNLEVRSNTNQNNGGTEASSNEKRYRLNIALNRNEDNVEMVAFSFLFTELREIDISYLFNEAMVYIPYEQRELVEEAEIIKEEAEVVAEDDMVVFMPEPETWRNKWLYLRVSADVPVNYYQTKDSFISTENGNSTFRLHDQIIMIPGVTVGFEVHFLNWIGAALNFEMRFADVLNYTPIPGAALQLKFPIKPASHFLLEPYIAGSISMNLADHSVSNPNFAAGGGFLFGVKGGRSGAWFFDVNYMHSLQEFRVKNIVNNYPKPDVLRWNRFVVGVGIGYKIGFIDRRR